MTDQPFPQGELIWSDVNGRRAFVVQPKRRVDGDRRWLWFTSCWHALPRYLEGADAGPEPNRLITHEYYVNAALDAGFHVAGVDVGVTCGSPAGTAVCQKFYEWVVQEHDLSRQARLIAQSNGGLIMYNWAAQYPDCVDRIFAIFPAVDLRIWPGLEEACREGATTYPELRYQMTSVELAQNLSAFNPIDQLAPLAAHNVKLFHVHGDDDQVVPFESNAGRLRQLYQELGGDVEVELIAGIGHQDGPQFYRSRRALKFLLD